MADRPAGGTAGCWGLVFRRALKNRDRSNAVVTARGLSAAITNSSRDEGPFTALILEARRRLCRHIGAGAWSVFFFWCNPRQVVYFRRLSAADESIGAPYMPPPQTPLN